MAESRTGAAEVMRCKTRNVHTSGGLLGKRARPFFLRCPSPRVSRPQTHRNSGPLSMPRLPLTKYQERFLYPFRYRDSPYVPSFADQVRRWPSAPRDAASFPWQVPQVRGAGARNRAGWPELLDSVFPRVRVLLSGDCQSADASPAVSQLPKREPSLRTPLTR